MTKVMDRIKMTSWRRPPGPPNVWKVIDGYETLKDGTRKLVKFSIQDMPNEECKRQEFMNLMLTHYLPNEPLSKSLKLKDDPVGIEEVKSFWQHGLDQGIIIACYQLDSYGKTEKLIGVNVTYIVDEPFRQNYAELKEGIKSNGFKKFLNLHEKLTSKADVIKIYNVDKYISSRGLSILPDYRGQLLACHLLNTRSDLAKKYGFKATSSMFSGEASQLQAKRAGFEEAYSIDYADLVDDEGNPEFPNIEAKSVKLMIKRLP